MHDTRPRRGSTGNRLSGLAMSVAVMALAGGTLLITAALVGSSLGRSPTPGPTTAHGTGPIGVVATPAPARTVDAIVSTLPPPGPTASPDPQVSPAPRPSAGGPFAIDLYRKGGFVSELSKVWCVPAAMQTSINIMATGPADTTRATQKRLFNLARKLAPAPDGAAEPEGWAAGLAKLGYGRFEVSVQPSIKAAIHVAAKALRATHRPVGLLVWFGAHSWVMSGFNATADPALTDVFTVTAVRIEDVWWPRFSTIWGYSDPPDTLVPVANLPRDYKPWKRPEARYPAKDGRFVMILPVP